MNSFLILTGWMLAALLAGAGILHLIPKLGATGRRVSDAFCRAPMLDVMITYFTVAPLFVAPMLGGWKGLAAAIVSQVGCVLIWTFLHEITHPEARRGP